MPDKRLGLVGDYGVPRPLDYLLSVSDELGVEPSYPITPDCMHISFGP